MCGMDAAIGGGFTILGVIVGACAAGWAARKDRREARRQRQLDALLDYLTAVDFFIKAMQANYLLDGQGSDQIKTELSSDAYAQVHASFASYSVAHTKVLVTVPKALTVMRAIAAMANDAEAVIDAVDRWEVEQRPSAWGKRVDGLPQTDRPLKVFERLQLGLTTVTADVGDIYAVD